MTVDSEIMPNVTLDLTGLTCPGPMLTAKRLSDEMENGQIMLLISNCPGTKDDLEAWTRHTHHQILKIEEMHDGINAYYVRKGDPWKVNIEIDMVGTSCPGPVVEAARLLQLMNDGEIIKLISNCEGSPADVKAWTKSTGHTLLNTTTDSNNIYSFYIQK